MTGLLMQSKTGLLHKVHLDADRKKLVEFIDEGITFHRQSVTEALFRRSTASTSPFNVPRFIIVIQRLFFLGEIQGWLVRFQRRACWFTIDGEVWRQRRSRRVFQRMNEIIDGAALLAVNRRLRVTDGLQCADHCRFASAKPLVLYPRPMGRVHRAGTDHASA